MSDPEYHAPIIGFFLPDDTDLVKLFKRARAEVLAKRAGDTRPEYEAEVEVVMQSTYPSLRIAHEYIAGAVPPRARWTVYRDGLQR